MMSGIIVGVDGSDQSCHALGWALREAVQRHAPLTVMTVRPVPARPATELYWAPLVYSEGSLDQEQARHAVQRLVDKTARGIGEPLPEVTVSLATGDPAEELVKATRDADLLVVGSRGAGGFAQLLLGSVSRKVAQRAHCPVMIIPPARCATTGS
jgi:nucleotide-binding universal stress UspA family protein